MVSVICVDTFILLGYSFIFDSAPLEYAARRKPCTITTVDLFRKFGYGLAFPKGSPLTSIFSQEILRLREGPILDNTYSNWFKAECDIDEGKINIIALDLVKTF